MRVKTPSGLTVEVRKLKGAEANILADRKAARKGQVFDKILRACVTSILDPGPYKAAEGGSDTFNWDPVLVCDRFYILVAIRVATHGSSYVFNVPCSKCDEDFEWEIDIYSDLEIFDLPESTIQKIAAGDNEFETTVGDDKITFRLMTGKDERAVGLKAKEYRAERWTFSVASRIHKVNGKRVAFDEAMQYAAEKDFDEQLSLIGKFEEVDGGIDQLINVECPECGREVQHNLPFEGAEFWTPSMRSRMKRKPSESRMSRKRTFGEG